MYLAGLCVGVAVLIAGVVWSVWGSGRVMYSPEQAQEFEAAGAALHAATMGHESHDGHEHEPPPADVDREALVAKARARYERAQATLESARFANNQLGKWLAGVGLAASLAFGIGYLSSRGQ